MKKEFVIIFTGIACIWTMIGIYCIRIGHPSLICALAFTLGVLEIPIACLYADSKWKERYKWDSLFFRSTRYSIVFIYFVLEGLYHQGMLK